ncbi:para-aminobenzoate synthase component I [Calothrix sp. NIES-4071]|nr:para-aminobenzoate synthase component I [Calothrix sp. NIES-4071]BAZ55779.1 para-aminobenzoate synthase component I [Calothrix sp. NIES-4105]
MQQNCYWHSQPLKNRTGSEIFATLFLSSLDVTIATLLESPYPNNNNTQARYSICAGAPRVCNGKLQMWTPQLGEILPFLRELLQQGREQVNIVPESLPFTGGWLGWLGYDLAWEIEQLPRNKDDSLPFPVAYWYEPESFAVLDHVEQTLWLAATEPSILENMKSKVEETVFVQEINNADKISQKNLVHKVLSTQSSQDEYETAVRKAKKYIQAGDIFQANLSLRFTTEINASGWDIYQALQKINPSPFACYYKTPWGEVVSCSPERLVEGKICGYAPYRVSTRPIAGTRRRGSTPEHDELLAVELLNNTKELAEHIMLVDLERNDLGRVCEWGTVKVDELLTIERYSHVMHLVSNVVGNLKSDLNAVDLVGAVFPGGTITGCPKIRCMEIIEELEPVRRSLFYGSVGYIDWRGNLDLNILIRTLLLTPNGNNNTVWGQVGAGIVADSDPEQEWYESHSKAEAQLTALRKVL